MGVCSPLRAFLYMCLFAFSVVLLGLTGYRIHYTKGLDNGDILTSSTNFYDPIIVELLVTSCLAIIFSLWLMIAILARIGGPLGSFGAEHLMIWIIWIMFLVGAAITTHDWSNLKWCRGSYKACRILETIKAFSWICWGFTTFVILASFGHMGMEKLGFGGTVAGESGEPVRATPQTHGVGGPVSAQPATSG
ncbi:hypothetical protein BDN70DRAFT_855794 [Pholiota conissans]|uniref:MARVEL domain-containing protein n=1 Tax=Pholiota conissans TaxID=109636 RepID=A0A9P6CUY0_9AGAR|nr:hypothetical protein BDN70DRAFT_855794 [Pholiota conissans]